MRRSYVTPPAEPLLLDGPVFGRDTWDVRLDRLVAWPELPSYRAQAAPRTNVMMEIRLYPMEGMDWGRRRMEAGLNLAANILDRLLPPGPGEIAWTHGRWHPLSWTASELTLELWEAMLREAPYWLCVLPERRLREWIAVKLPVLRSTPVDLDEFGGEG